MNELLSYSSELKHEANQLVVSSHLLDLLREYGCPLSGESFELNVMTNRIINFYVGNDEMDEESIFHMGYQLTKRFNPYKVIFANEKDKYQWSVYMIQKGEEWKLDISVLPENIVKGKVEKQELLKSLFTEKKRECILFFKQQSGYNRYYTSDHVYKAVLEDDIHDDMSFFMWLQRQKKVNQQT
jgi:hypothetical protein